MNAKKIFSKTWMFVAIIAFIVLFQKIFGEENTLVGVTVITAALVFLERDLTSNLGKFLVIFLVTNIAQGLIAYMAQGNIYLGVIGTFISMFVTGYIFTYNLKSPMYIASGLQYIFMLYSPVSSEQLPTRLLALSVGAVIVIIFQIFNKNRLTKISDAMFPYITESFSKKVNSVILLDYKGEEDKAILKGVKQIRKAVLESRVLHFYTTMEGKLNLNISIFLERSNILIDRIYEDLNKESIGEDEKKFLLSFKEILLGLPKCKGNGENTKELIKEVKEFIAMYKNISGNPLGNISEGNIREFIENMDFLEHNLSEAVEVSKKDYRKVNRKTSIPEIFKTSFILRKNFTKKSLKFSYAFRSALMVSIGYFIVKYFDLEAGKWLVFTLFSVTQPYIDEVKPKSFNRLKGTIIGMIIFLILFSIVTDTTGRTIIIMLAGYLNSYVDRYDHKTIFVTISALGAAAIIGNVAILALDRVVYVIVGIIIAIIGNRIIFPYSIKDSTKYLMSLYEDVFNEIHMEISLASKGKGNIQKMRNLIMETALIEDRLYMNAEVEDEDMKIKIEKTLEKHRIEINDLYDEYLGVHSKKLS